MNCLKFCLMIMLFLFLILPVEAGLFGPDNYDECITESMKGVTSDVAARAIIISCRKRFPEETKKLPPSKILSDDQLFRVTGRAGLSYGNYFAGNLYNGNGDIYVSEISVYVTTQYAGKEVQRIYQCKVNIAPLTSAAFGFDIIIGDKGANYSWGLVEAKGYYPE